MSKSLLPPPFSHTPSRALCWQSPTRSRWLRGKVAGRVPAPTSKKKTKRDKVGLELRRKSTITKRVTWEILWCAVDHGNLNLLDAHTESHLLPHNLIAFSVHFTPPKKSIIFVFQENESKVQNQHPVGN